MTEKELDLDFDISLDKPRARNKSSKLEDIIAD
jgi:copper homeostasis protein CutC